MKRILGMMALLVLATPGATLAQSAPTASAPAAGHYTTEETDVGTLLDDPAAKAILVKHLPAIAGSDQIEMARSLTLKVMQQFAPDQVSDETLAKIDADLAKLPAKR